MFSVWQIPNSGRAGYKAVKTVVIPAIAIVNQPTLVGLLAQLGILPVDAPPRYHDPMSVRAPF
jgi:hypothetical protein